MLLRKRTGLQEPVGFLADTNESGGFHSLWCPESVGAGLVLTTDCIVIHFNRGHRGGAAGWRGTALSVGELLGLGVLWI